jgi:hypothetical protein
VKTLKDKAAERPPPSGKDAISEADQVVKTIVANAVTGAKGGARARITNAPAGAGKTGTVLKIVGALRDKSARVGVVTQTNEQAFDVVGRLAEALPNQTISFMHANDVELPEQLQDKKKFPLVATIKAEQARGTSIVVATADKWAYSRNSLSANAFDAGIIDEAYQMTSAKLYRVVDYFKSIDLIGDPGQLDPFTTVDETRWEGLRGNPVMNAVDALIAHHPKTPKHSLPVTRRLPHTAAGIIREAFYPDLRFGASTGPGERRLEFATKSSGPKWATGALITAAVNGWAYVELPERPSLPLDGQIVETLATLAEQFFARSPRVFDERTGAAGREIRPEHGRVAIGVVHRNQRAAVTLALQQRGLGDHVVVDTANRLQGREFDVVLVWHPLAGRTDATEFHLDAGRMCVLTTRHRQACILVGRGGTARLLEDHPPPGRVVLGVSKDPEFDGWEAHVRLLEHFESVRVAV